MATKLTLRIDETLIEHAKAYGRTHGKSVSRLVADYFAALDPAEPQASPTATPMVTSLRGVLKDKGLDQETYREHIAKKFG